MEFARESNKKESATPPRDTLSRATLKSINYLIKLSVKLELRENNNAEQTARAVRQLRKMNGWEKDERRWINGNLCAHFRLCVHENQREKGIYTLYERWLKPYNCEYFHFHFSLVARQNTQQEKKCRPKFGVKVFLSLFNTENSALRRLQPFSLKVENLLALLLSKVIKLKLTLQYRWTNKPANKEKKLNQKNLIMSVVEPCRSDNKRDCKVNRRPCFGHIRAYLSTIFNVFWRGWESYDARLISPTLPQ